MKYLGLSTVFAAALALSATVSADDSDISTAQFYQTETADNLLAHNGGRHYRSRHYRDNRKHRRHHRKHRNHNRHYDRGQRRGFHLNYHVYPSYHRDNRRHYRGRRHHRRHRDYHCGSSGDGFKWLAGAIVANELIHYAFDNPQDEWQYSRHDYRSAFVDNRDHEQHYRDYHAQRYSGG